MVRIIFYKLKKIGRYALISLLLSLVLFIGNYNLSSLFIWFWSLSLGVFVGLFEEFVVGRWLLKRAAIWQVIIRVLVINVFAFSMLMLIAFWELGELNFSKIFGAAANVEDQRYLRMTYNAFIISILLIFYFQMEAFVGRKMFGNYLLGRYALPREEERIFMFIDMQDSTTHAERMSNDLFYELVNDCFYLVTSPVLKTKAEILKYVGDEIIFTWPMKDGLKNNNCIEIIVSYRRILESKKAYFEEKYGFVPFFKAGVHGGKCIGAEVGHLKKAIDFSGDVLSTAARIQGVCNEHKAELLVSKSLFEKLPNKNKYQIESVGGLDLKGKEESVEVIKVIL